MHADPRQLAAIIEAQETIAAAGLDVSALMTVLATSVRDLSAADGAVVELVDRDGVVIRAAAASAAVQVGLALPDAGASGRAVLLRKLVRWTEAQAEPGTTEGRGTARSVIAAPLAARGAVLGVLTVTSEAPDAFSADHEAAVQALARFSVHQLAHAIKLEQVERTSRLDPLTGLGNRRALDECLSHELARHVRYGRGLALVMFDLNGFKQVNDVHGHQAGDRVLAQVGRRLGEVRGADAAFRLGGDEFAVVLPETRLEAAELVARRLVGQIREDTFPHQVGAAYGVAQATSADPAELVGRADQELYARKREGRPAPGASGIAG